MSSAGQQTSHRFAPNAGCRPGNKRRFAFQQRQVGAYLNRAFLPEKQPNMRLTGRASRRVNITSPANLIDYARIALPV